MESTAVEFSLLGPLLGLLVGVCLGLVGGLAWGRGRARQQNATLQGQLVLVTAERDALRRDSATSASLDAMVGPLRESLQQLRASAERANVQRSAAESALRTHMEQVQSRYDSLETATRQIAGALAKGHPWPVGRDAA
ncbi:MAG: hypothetical protein ACKOE2_02700 [Actinomycetales bacterium]